MSRSEEAYAMRATRRRLPPTNWRGWAGGGLGRCKRGRGGGKGANRGAAARPGLWPLDEVLLAVLCSPRAESPRTSARRREKRRCHPAVRVDQF